MRMLRLCAMLQAACLSEWTRQQVPLLLGNKQLRRCLVRMHAHASAVMSVAAYDVCMLHSCSTCGS